MTFRCGSRRCTRFLAADNGNGLKISRKGAYIFYDDKTMQKYIAHISLQHTESTRMSYAVSASVAA